MSVEENNPTTGKTQGKSLGQAAYEAYAGHTQWKSLVSGQPLPQWDQLNGDIRDAWEVAANAVRHVLRCIVVPAS